MAQNRRFPKYPGPPSYKTGTRHVLARYWPCTSLGPDLVGSIRAVSRIAPTGVMCQSLAGRSPWPTNALALALGQRISQLRAGFLGFGFESLYHPGILRGHVGGLGDVVDQVV